jgi:hypothetical protein
MKRISLFLSVCILLLARETTLAQTASDYYLPLSVGSHASLHTVWTQPTPPFWGPRVTTFSIEGSDSISGQLYFREKGLEVMDETSDSSVFHVVWLREDSAGNVILGAIGTTGSSDIDSATVFNWNWFPNEFLTKGYSRTYTQGEQTSHDSVISVTETVSMPAGTFNNCLKICETTFDSNGAIVSRGYDYYAYGIGLIKSEGTLPDSFAHIDELVDYGTAVAFSSIAADSREGAIVLQWGTAADEALKGFRLYRAPRSGDFSCITASPLSSDARTYEDRRIEPGKEYRYTVAAITLYGREIRSPEVIASSIASSLALDQNSPNPFNPQTTIGFSLPGSEHVRLDIYDLGGRLVQCLVDKPLQAGHHQIEWNGKDAGGRTVASGMYFYRLTVGKQVSSKKMVLLR